MFEKLAKFLADSEPAIFFLSLAVTVLGAIVSALAKRGAAISFETAAAESEEIKRPKDILEIRLDEVRELLKKQERIARAYGYASAILTFGQFIVGGLLATSFLQETLSKTLVGALGLLVLISSLIRQYYRPDVQSSGARERIVRLKALIREAENQLSLLEEGNEAMSRQEILSMLTQGLSYIEEAELRQMQSNMQIDAPTSKPIKKRAPKSPRAT